MPIIKSSVYQPPVVLRNPHFNTIFAALCRQVSLDLVRERIELPDGDFLDLDWSDRGSDKLVIVLHGLEGNAGRPYVKGLIRWFNQQGWDGVGMNFRGCSGELNRRLKTYHMGATEDLDAVVNAVLEKDKYRQIVIAGYSLGGNVTLKYLGEKGPNLPKQISHGLAFSVPCDIAGSNEEIRKPKNQIYLKRFLKTMNQKIIDKGEMIEHFDPVPYGRPARNFNEFDEWYTAPINGFDSAFDYWTKTSSIFSFDQISIPTLLLNAKDDTFLSPSCFPFELSRESKHLYLESPNHGGHVGFVEFKYKGAYYPDRRGFQFVSES